MSLQQKKLTKSCWIPCCCWCCTMLFGLVVECEIITNKKVEQTNSNQMWPKLALNLCLKVYWNPDQSYSYSDNYNRHSLRLRVCCQVAASSDIIHYPQLTPMMRLSSCMVTCFARSTAWSTCCWWSAWRNGSSWLISVLSRLAISVCLCISTLRP